MRTPNFEMVLAVAKALGELNNEVVFVGGSITEFYSQNVILDEIRPTIDVDVVVEISAREEYECLEIKLREKGFKNDITQGSPLCRWKLGCLTVDIMPNDKRILGFTNKWYSPGILNFIEKKLDDKIKIKIFAPLYFLATKIEAIKGRALDLRMSHDFEDFIYVFCNTKDIVSEIDLAEAKLRQYLIHEISNLKLKMNFEEALEVSLPLGSDELFDMLILEIEAVVNL